MLTSLVALFIFSTPADTSSLIGSIRVVGSGPNRQVLLTADNKDTYLAGDLLNELGHLSGSKVELVGHVEGTSMRVDVYRILDVGQGAKPLVGMLVALPGSGGSNNLALADGEGEPVPLSLSAASQERLQVLIGAKIWVFGKKLLSGELRVARFGLLREPVGRIAPQTNGDKP